MKNYLKYFFTFLTIFLFGIKLFGQTNDNVSNLISSRERLDNTPTATLKYNEHKIINDQTIFVNSQKVEMNSVFQNVQAQLSIINIDHDLSTMKLHLKTGQPLNAKKETYNLVEIKPIMTRIINDPKASVKKK